ncbi:MAG: leucyl aminopeptidase [Bacteroidales bacterium]|nr:leucyl aminopeptidase [Bacteroidales bacterium]
MNCKLNTITLKGYEGNFVFLLGDDVAERNLPFSKKEIEFLRARRDENRETIVRFDRLPYYAYVVTFDSDKPAEESQEHLRRSADRLRTMMIADKVFDAALSGEGIIPEEMMAFVEGLVLADYTFDRYKTKQPEHLGTIEIDDHFFSAEEFEANQRLWNRIFWCREWVNLPVQDLNAVQFANELKSIADDLGVECTVFDKRQIESLRMGGLLAVNRGSVDEPRFVVLEYKPDNAINAKPLALVGKGVMYDTGGLNIKPDDYMQEMKSDMAGAATMASTLFAAADNNLPVHIVALLPMTDNRPGFNAYAADDILTMYDGTTVEVVNTDAEGRLILADAIAYAAKNYDPELIIDAATLTGAAVRAISTFGIAVMQQNASAPYNLLSIVGEKVYERVVMFPFWKEYDELIKSDVADIKNCGPAQAGTITAGKFLAHFAKEVPYIHLDIAGVAYFSKKQQYYAPGASGYGIRLLYAFLQTYDILHK